MIHEFRFARLHHLRDSAHRARGLLILSQRRFAEACRFAEIGVLVRPENGNAWYTLAVARAATGNTRRALDALEQAMAHGFRSRERIEAEPLLDKVRREKKYAELMK